MPNSFDSKCRSLLDPFDPRRNTVLQLYPARYAKPPSQQLFGLRDRFHIRQIPAFIFRRFRNLVVLRPQFVEEIDDICPIVRCRKCENSLVLDSGIEKCGDVEACTVADVDKPL